MKTVLRVRGTRGWRGPKRDPSGGELCWTPRVSESRAIQRFRAPSGGEVPKRSEWWGTLLHSPGPQKVRTVLRVRAASGGEVPTRSELKGALQDSPGAQKLRTVLRFRASRGEARSNTPPGRRGSTAVLMAGSSAGFPLASKSEDISMCSRPQWSRGPKAIRLYCGELCWIPQGLKK